MLKARIKHLSEKLNISKEIVTVHDHHESHAYYGYISSPYRNYDSLVYTMDGGGDNANGTVSIGKAGAP